MKLPPAACLFDLDGLLLDTEPLHGRGWWEAAAHFGTQLSEAQLMQLKGRRRLDCAAQVNAWLAEPVGTDALSASTTLSGYVSTSYHGGSGSGKYPYALSHENRSSFTLDIVGLSLRCPLNEWLFDSGYRVDLWLGPSFRFRNE